MIIAGVWITSALYSIPKFLFVHTVENALGNGKMEAICIINRKMYDSKLFDYINFGILYMIPLLVISVSTNRWMLFPKLAINTGFYPLLTFLMIVLLLAVRYSTVELRWRCGGVLAAWSDISPCRTRPWYRRMATALIRTVRAVISRR